MKNKRETWFRRIGPPSHFDVIHWEGTAVMRAGFGACLLSFSIIAVFGKGHPLLIGICIALGSCAVAGMFAAIARRVER